MAAFINAQAFFSPYTLDPCATSYALAAIRHCVCVSLVQCAAQGRGGYQVEIKPCDEGCQKKPLEEILAEIKY